MTLKIALRVDPPPKTMPPEEFDRRLDPVVADFEADFEARCLAKGLPAGKLLPMEKATLKQFVLYLSMKTEEGT